MDTKICCEDCYYYEMLIGPDMYGGPTDRCYASEKEIVFSHNTQSISYLFSPYEKNNNNDCSDFRKVSTLGKIINKVKRKIIEWWY